LHRILFLYHVLVNKTPTPIFVGFKGLDNGMLGLLKMFGGVFIFGIVAAADVSAGETQTQVNPRIAHF
jgi:hypothetical protein